MDTVTQQNAALVEQAAAAAGSLSHQADTMQKMVGAFTVGDATHGPAAQRDGHEERRGPDRAINVSRIAQKRTPARTPPAAPLTRREHNVGPSPTPAAAVAAGTDDWAQF